MRYPTIGITQAFLSHRPRNLPDYLNREAYFRAVRQAGGNPIEITSNTIKSDLTCLDGVVFSGGGDIHPRNYGGNTVESVSNIDEQRDRFEMDLLHMTVDKDIPFLGICRGLQLINVSLGGSLYRDLDTQKPSGLHHDWHPARMLLAHEVSLETTSILKLVGFTRTFPVNSLHHQGVREIGSGISAMAYSPDGLIEAIKLTGHRFGLAVQWHPEWLTDQLPTRNLFTTFIYACESAHQ
jgi:putative glutamine amidotransferase